MEKIPQLEPDLSLVLTAAHCEATNQHPLADAVYKLDPSSTGLQKLCWGKMYPSLITAWDRRCVDSSLSAQSVRIARAFTVVVEMNAIAHVRAQTGSCKSPKLRTLQFVLLPPPPPYRYHDYLYSTVHSYSTVSCVQPPTGQIILPTTQPQPTHHSNQLRSPTSVINRENPMVTTAWTTKKGRQQQRRRQVI